MKQCTHCGKTKPLDEFHRDQRRADGRHPWCKQCRSEYGHPTRQPESTRAQSRAWAAASKRLREAHPDEFRAYYDQELSKQA